MIFNVPGHIVMIRNGLYLSHRILNSHIDERTIKTQTRRLNRGVYQVGRDYAVQCKRGVKAEPDIRIVMDSIWEENGLGISGGNSVGMTDDRYLSEEDALAEGGYTPKLFEELFSALNPKRDWIRWAFKFHVIKVRKC